MLHLLRGYSAMIVVVSSALLVSATNVASGKGTNSLIFGYWEGSDESAVEGASKKSIQTVKRTDLALVPIAKANSSVDPSVKEEDTSQSILPGQSLAVASGGIQKDPEEDGGVKMYTVQQGDTLSSIAQKNKISVKTIMWANDLDNVDSIMPGDTLFILPVSGLSYTVKNGDTIDAIASKYGADKSKIISFNDLPADGSLDEGKEIIIPDGEKKDAAQNNSNTNSTNNSTIERRQYATASGGAPAVSGGKSVADGRAGTGHKFPYGYCTWYVAQKRYVPWGGNAGTWLYHAKAAGYSTGKTPRPGAIMVTTESAYYGHVALVESVSGNTITVSEMNYRGWGKVSRRTLSASSRAIKGFIY